MTELVERMTRLADAGVGDRALVDPSTAPRAEPERHGRRPWVLGAAAAAVLVVLAVVAVAVDGRGGDDEPVNAGPGTSTPGTDAPPSSDSVPAAGVPGGPLARLSIALVDAAIQFDDPLGLTFVVRDDEGTTIAERSSAEVEVAGRTVEQGIVVDLPGAGIYEVVVGTGRDARITCSVPVATDDRAILPILTEDGSTECGVPQPVEEWAGDSGEVGQRYRGLTEAEAVAAVEADGYTSRVTGRDGLRFVITADLSPDRVDLLIYDGVVVSAALGGEARVSDEPPRVDTPLAVVLTSVDGALTGRNEVLVGRAGRAESREWGPAEDGQSAVSVLFHDVEPGASHLDIQGEGCTLSFDVAATGTVVTIEVRPDATVSSQDCPATVETLDEHVARVTEGWVASDPADAFVGLTEAEAITRAEEEGRELRVVGRDGRSFGHDLDFNPDRVNLVLYDDEVRAAALF